MLKGNVKNLNFDYARWHVQMLVKLLTLTISTSCWALRIRHGLLGLLKTSTVALSPPHPSFGRWPANELIGTSSLWILGSLATFFLSSQVYFFYYYWPLTFTFACSTCERSTPMRIVLRIRGPLHSDVSPRCEKNRSNIHFSLNWLYPRSARSALLLFSEGFRWIFSLKESKRRSLQGDAPLSLLGSERLFFLFLNSTPQMVKLPESATLFCERL